MNWKESEVAALDRNFVGVTSPKPQKYNARSKEIDGIKFDSSREAKRYVELKALQSVGAIRNLELQPRYLLQAGFRDESGKWIRKIEYVADFRYEEWRSCMVAPKGGDLGFYKSITEDVKGMVTPVYALKRKLFAAKYPQIDFREVK